MDLLGEWNGPEDDDHKLVFGPAGVQSSGIICTRNLSFESIQSTGENRWKFTTDDSQIKGGVILKMPDGTLNISAKGSGCYAEGMTGIFRKSGAVAEKAPPVADNPVAEAKAPAGDCNAACDNAVEITIGAALKQLPNLPPQVKAQMEAQMGTAKIQAKQACLASCRPENAHCMTQAKTITDMGQCQLQSAGKGDVAPVAAVAAAAPVAAAPVAAAPAEAVADSAPKADSGGFAVGSRVSCNWKDYGTYYNGRVTRKSGNSVHIKYDDGDEEDTNISKCRLAGSDSAAAESDDEESDDEESASSGGDTVRVNIKVKLKRTKSNGSNWDAFGGEPDIAICVDSDSGIKCYPDGDSVSGILEPECQDSFRCTFRNISVPADGFELTVVDVDLASNDTAGSEDCEVGKKCTVGRAKVTITKR
jgi:hypothetical protein